MDNKGKFKVGTKFVGDNNGVRFEVLKIEQKKCLAESGQLRESNVSVVLKNLDSGHQFNYGLRALERCYVTILNEEGEGDQWENSLFSPQLEAMR